MFVLSFESLQQLDYLLNYFGCQQTAICDEGMFSHIMTTDSWCQTGYAFQFVSGNNNNYSSCKSSLHYSMNSFCGALFRKNTQLHAHHLRQAAGRTAEDGKQHGKLCRGWPSTLREICLWFTLGTREAILDFRSWCTLLTTWKIWQKTNPKFLLLFNCVRSLYFSSSAARHWWQCYARGDEQQRLLAVRFKNRWCGRE